MFSLSIYDIPDDVRLAEPVLDLAEPDTILLAAGEPFRADYRNKLESRGILRVLVAPDDVDRLREMLGEIEAVWVEGIVRAVQHANGVNPEEPTTDRLIRIMAAAVADYSAIKTPLAGWLADPENIRHAASVCDLGMSFGRDWVYRNGLLDYRGQHTFDDLEDRLVQLGLGLLLHDLTAQTDGDQHPLSAGKLLGDPYFLPLVRATVRQHHERWDGQGLPSGFSGSGIHVFARICAIADRYDCLRKGRELAPSCSRSEALAAIAAQAGSFFDPQLAAAFVSHMERHPSLDIPVKPGEYGELLVELVGPLVG